MDRRAALLAQQKEKQWQLQQLEAAAVTPRVSPRRAGADAQEAHGLCPRSADSAQRDADRAVCWLHSDRGEGADEAPTSWRRPASLNKSRHGPAARPLTQPEPEP